MDHLRILDIFALLDEAAVASEVYHVPTKGERLRFAQFQIKVSASAQVVAVTHVAIALISQVHELGQAS
jgi:hypothetical protein